jgi:hypothetical protein
MATHREMRKACVCRTTYNVAHPSLTRHAPVHTDLPNLHELQPVRYSPSLPTPVTLLYFFFLGFFFFTPPAAVPPVPAAGASASMGVPSLAAASAPVADAVAVIAGGMATGAAGGRRFAIFCMRDRLSASKRLRKRECDVLNFKHCDTGERASVMSVEMVVGEWEWCRA